MKKNSLLILVCMLCAFCSEESKDKTQDVYIKDEILLWRVDGNGLKKSSYIYGTYPSYDSRAHEFTDSVLLKLDACDDAVFENPDFEAMNAIEQKKSISLPQSTSLKNILSKDDYNFVRNQIFAIGGKDTLAYDSIKPFYTIQQFEPNRSINEMEDNVFQSLYHRAKKANKKIIGLETNQEFNSRLDETSLQNQGKLLVNYFKNFHSDSLFMERLIGAYRGRRLQRVYDSLNTHKDIMYFSANYSDANCTAYLNKLIPLMQQQFIFCAVNVLYLPGENGLINALRKKGYTLTPVYSKHIPKIIHVEDKRKWINFKYDALGFMALLPEKPNFTVQTTEDDMATTGYVTIDSTILHMGFSCQAIKMKTKDGAKYDADYYDARIAYLSHEENWHKMSEKEIMFKGIKCREVEFNISNEMNIRYKICQRGYYLYYFGVIANKPLLYSDRAEFFYDNIFFLNKP